MGHVQRQDHNHHDHDHHRERHSRWEQLRHTLLGLVDGHSHDPADQVDAALEADRTGRRALWIKSWARNYSRPPGVVVVLSGSVALLGDTLHNIADAPTAVPLLVASRLASTG